MIALFSLAFIRVVLKTISSGLDFKDLGTGCSGSGSAGGLATGLRRQNKLIEGRRQDRRRYQIHCSPYPKPLKSKPEEIVFRTTRINRNGPPGGPLEVMKTCYGSAGGLAAGLR